MMDKMKRFLEDSDAAFCAMLLIGMAVLLAVCAWACLCNPDGDAIGEEDASLLDFLGGQIVVEGDHIEVLPADKVRLLGRYLVVDCEDGRLLAFRTGDIDRIDLVP